MTPTDIAMLYGAVLLASVELTAYLVYRLFKN
jgi:hypothetical protein